MNLRFSGWPVWLAAEIVAVLMLRTGAAQAEQALTNMAQVVAIGKETPRLGSYVALVSIGHEAPRMTNYSAHVRGVVTFPLTDMPWLFVQEGSNALIVTYPGAITNYPVGTIIDAEGPVYAGMFAPYVEASRISIVGSGPLPAAKPGDYARLSAGEDFARFMRVRGFVRDISIVRDRLILQLRGGAETGQAQIRIPPDYPLPVDWLDAEVEVQGICWTLAQDDKPVSFAIHSANTDMITVLRSGAGPWFDRPVTPVKSLAALPTDGSSRVRVQGTVTLHSASGRLYLADETGPLRVDPMVVFYKGALTRTAITHTVQMPLKPGDRVEVVGSPAASMFAPTLADAEYRRLEAGTPPAPIRASVAALRSGKLDGQLVTVRARLMDREVRRDGNVFTKSLVLQADDEIFEALLEQDHPSDFQLERNDYVDVTGVDTVQAGQWGTFHSVKLRLRSPEDLQRAPPPYLWERPGALRTLGSAGIITLLAVGLAAYQRRQIARLRASDEAARRSETVTRTVNDFATSLLAQNTEDEILWELAQNCISRLGFSDCMVYLLDHERRVLVQRAALGGKCPGGRVILNPLEIPWGRGIVGSVAASGRAEVIGDTSVDARYIVDDERRFSELAVPIVANQKVIGVIDSEHPRRNFFTTEHLTVLMAISAVCANKLVRVRAEQELRALNAELEQRVVGRTTELRAANAQLLREVVAREQAEAEMRVALEAERDLNQLKSNFVSMVSHEFRTPLGVILSSNNILDRYLERLQPDQRRAQFRAIRKSIARMNDLIEDVLLLGKFEGSSVTCQPVRLDLVLFCRRAIGEIESAAERPGAVRLDAAEPQMEAEADESLLHHIVVNLLSNALKYSSPDSPVVLSVSRQGDQAKFAIRDEGCGIPAGDQPRLFTAFYRGSNVGKKPGSGLGLVIVKRCVDLQGGTIACETSTGRGTTFTVTLPLFSETRYFHRRLPSNGEPLSPITHDQNSHH